MLHCNSCSKMFASLKHNQTNLILKNSKKHIFRLTRLFHLSRLKDFKVNTSFKVDDEKEPIADFANMMEVRFKQARKSVLVQVRPDKQFSQLNDFCSSLGKMNSICNYVLPNSKLYFSLIEFKDTETLSEIQIRCRESNWELLGLPRISPFLLFHELPETPQNVSTGTNLCNDIVTDYGMLPSEQQIANNLLEVETISNQIEKLYDETKLNDLGIRLRFLTAFQMESALSGIFPNARCFLFGSTVNGCGRINSDLDLFLNFNNDLKKTTSFGQLVSQVKTSKFTNDRARLQKHMEVLADFIQNFLPGCNNVIRILQARVPIIKYKHEYTGIDCDLSLTNINSVTMSKLLYNLNGMDWRIRPLLLTVKYWAEKANVTNPFPGHWISNFSLSLLVMFYLQQIKIIPNIDDVVVLKRTGENDVTCTFLYDSIQQFIVKNQENTTLSEILLGFFEYYLKFDFDLNGISLNSGQTVSKSNTNEAMCIVNPLDQELNVSKNVNFEEVKNLKIKLTETASLLSSQIVRGKDDTREWGLIPLLKDSMPQNKVKSYLRKNVRHRLVDVKELFNDS